MRILFLHPDLGIGGAERLVVDAAVAYKEAGHGVYFVTNHHDLNHCFPETRDGRLPVHVVASWFPRSIFGRFKAFCAYVRMILAALFVTFVLPVDHDIADPDVIFCDQISAPIPFLRLARWLFSPSKKHPRIVFYCHFPDMLLTQRKTLLKTLYRKPLDWLEEASTGCADVILANSKFTESVFRSTFKSLSSVPVKVVYPSCNFSSFDRPLTSNADKIGIKTSAPGQVIFLSINRYERKKNISLALQALARLQTIPDCVNRVHLIIAGGYDDVVEENRQYYEELVKEAEKLHITTLVTFLKSPDDETKRTLLHSCRAVIYTPENEHFGIVPLEAMYSSRPVIACKSGGPLETVIDEETGLLCDPTPVSFSHAMGKLIKSRDLALEMGVKGRQHVISNFSFKTFQRQLLSILYEE